jgi:hypothetical protein
LVYPSSFTAVLLLMSRSSVADGVGVDVAVGVAVGEGVGVVVAVGVAVAVGVGLAEGVGVLLADDWGCRGISPTMGTRAACAAKDTTLSAEISPRRKEPMENGRAPVEKDVLLRLPNPLNCLDAT